MKRIWNVLSAALVLAGCSMHPEEFPLEETTCVTRSYEAGLGDDSVRTRTSVDAAGKVSWEAGDVVRYYSAGNGEVREFTVEEAGPKAALSLDMSTDASFLVAVTGAASLSGCDDKKVTLHGAVPATQSGVFGDHHVAVAKTCDVARPAMSFRNITSCIRFTLSRTDVAKVVFSSNDSTPLHAGGTVDVTFDGEDVLASLGSEAGPAITVSTSGAGTFYITTLPCTLAEGFKADCYDVTGVYLGSASTSKSVQVRAGTILNLGTLDTRIEKTFTDLSAEGTANCYIVSGPGDYKFKANVMGGSNASLGDTPYIAVVLWESFGTDVVPSAGDLVSDVTFKDGCIFFTASALKGNAVIAVEDRGGKILWSWHIWMTDNPEDQVYNNGAGTLMDRNLGATSASPGDVQALGLLYQWGRKDPFLSGASVDYLPSENQLKAASTCSWPSAVTPDISNNIVSYAVAHPTTFVKSANPNADWYDAGDRSTDDTLWQTSDKKKSVYDPCPPGYRVPDGGSTGVWSRAFGFSRYWETASNWDSTCMGMNFGAADRKLGGASAIWYPASGLISYYNGTLANVGYYGVHWSASPNGSLAHSMLFVLSGGVSPSDGSPRGNGQSVRCSRE